MIRLLTTLLVTACLPLQLLAQSPVVDAIAAAPAFTSDQLTAPPTQNWITNGGSIFNQRYSPLDQINRSNVGELRATWRTSMGSADNFRNSGQTQILAWEGTLFVTNGENDVFALDADTGEILWTHHGMPAGGSGNSPGWANRGARSAPPGDAQVAAVTAEPGSLDVLFG